MLVLTLKPGEQLHIGDEVVVTLSKVIDTNKVRLGIEAPPEVVVLREELTPRNKQQTGAT